MMGALKEIFNFSVSTVERSPQIIGFGALFYLAATTIAETATTGAPFWSTLSGNAWAGVDTIFDAGANMLSSTAA